MAPCRWPFPLKPVYNGGKSFTPPGDVLPSAREKLRQSIRIRPNDLRKLAAYVVLIANAIAVNPPLLQWQSVLTESAVLPCEAACVDGAKPQPIETTVAKPRVHSKPSVDEAVD